MAPAHEVSIPKNQSSRSDGIDLEVSQTSTQRPRTESTSREGTRARIHSLWSDDVGLQVTRTNTQSGGLEVPRTSNQSPRSGSGGLEVQQRSKRRHLEKNQLLKEEPFLEHQQRDRNDEN